MVISLISNAVIGLCMTLFLLSTLHERRLKSFWKTFVLLLLCGFYVSLYSMLLFPENTNPMLKMFVGLAWDTAWAMLLFKDKRWKVVMCTVILFMHMAIAEVVGPLIYSIDLYDTRDLYNQSTDQLIIWYSVYVAVYGTLLYITQLIVNRNADKLGWQELLLLAVSPLMQVAISLFMITPSYTQTTGWRIASIVFCLINDVMLFLVIRGLAQRTELRVTNELLNEQVENEKQHYEALVDQFETARTLRHDIANHMYTIQVLLSSGDTERAAQYAAEIAPKHKFSSSLGRCENRIVDAFMASRISKLADSGIRIETDVILPQVSLIADSDLIIAFGNMMNNAEEACRKMTEGDRFIYVYAREENGCCTIRMENSTSDDKSRKERIHGLERGIGTSILNNLAAQYKGTFITGEKDGVFRAALTMLLQQQA